MIGQSRQRVVCDNLNHRRERVSVRHCPSCGDVVNDRVDVQPCSEAHHAAARRQRSEFCVDCGARLIANG